MKHVYIVWAIDDDYEPIGPCIVAAYASESKANARASRLRKRVSSFDAVRRSICEMAKDDTWLAAMAKNEARHRDVAGWRDFDRFEVEKVAVRQ